MGARRAKLSLQYGSKIKMFGIVRSRTRLILVECNQLAEKRNDIFGKGNLVESFRFHPILILLYLKQCQFYNTF